MTNQYELEQVYNYTRIGNVKPVKNFSTLEYSRSDIYTSTLITSSSDSDDIKKSNNDDFLGEIAEYCSNNYADNTIVCYLSDIKAVGSYSTVDSAIMYTLVAEIKIYFGHGAN
jgi:hypothetical protein